MSIKKNRSIRFFTLECCKKTLKFHEDDFSCSGFMDLYCHKHKMVYYLNWKYDWFNPNKKEKNENKPL